MANAYITIAQFFVFYDVRTMRQLSGDDANHEGNPSNLQTLLDAEASDLESSLAGRYSLPLATVPPVLTKWVAARVAGRLFARRNEKPKQVQADLDWADTFIDNLIKGRIKLKDLDRAIAPTLSSSDFTDGRSRWDKVLGGRPSQSGPSRGQ